MVGASHSQLSWDYLPCLPAIGRPEESFLAEVRDGGASV